jgi:hypothetical protein
VNVASRFRRNGAAVPALLAALALAWCAAPASAFEFKKIAGHMEFGYGRLTTGNAPAGSITLGAGVDYPLPARLREGLDLGFYLFGSEGFERGSLNATVDYSAFDLVLFTHWEPVKGPIARISLGPGLTRARAQLSAAAGGASFLDLAINDACPTAALDLTFMKRKPAPVRVALVLSDRYAFRTGEDWHHFSVRLGFHY